MAILISGELRYWIAKPTADLQFPAPPWFHRENAYPGKLYQIESTKRTEFFVQLFRNRAAFDADEERLSVPVPASWFEPYVSDSEPDE